MDDLVLIPLGITIAIRLIPYNILEECQVQAEEVFKEGKPKNWVAGAIIVLIWVAAFSFIIFKIIDAFH